MFSREFDYIIDEVLFDVLLLLRDRGDHSFELLLLSSVILVHLGPKGLFEFLVVVFVVMGI